MPRVKPRVVSPAMRVRAYAVLSRAVEEGVACGLRLAYKHADDAPDEAEIMRVADVVSDEVLDAITNMFTFPEDVE